MAYTDVDNAGNFFKVLKYTGNDTSGRGITGVGFQPDWVWIKNRSDGDPHKLFDVVRGAGKSLKTNSVDGQATNEENGYVSAFNSDGFTLTSGSSSIQDVNKNNENYISWNWLAGGSASSNSNGTITSSVSANTTSGFSIVTWTGDGSKSATVGHGLGAELGCIISKETDGTDWWHNWYSGLSGDSYNVFFNQTNAERAAYNDGHLKKLDNTTTFGFDSSTSNVNAVNQNGINNVAYCFVEKQGFSKFGKYIGNGSSDGPFVYTGFKVAYIYAKKINGTSAWRTWDKERVGYNRDNKFVYCNYSNAEESDGSLIDLCSQGFKFRGSSGDMNGNGDTYIFAAFAENPFVSSTGVPGTAK
tara:strand:+ start:778 stop:1851 length:1074 start_codon:yes stop_codon:yes gene_type:complete